jgi:tricorn protease
MFDEAWRYEKDYFYDPNIHGRDWDEVYKRYAPLIPYVKHRADLTYILDQVNGELSVGHSFVFGGDYPEVETPSVGLLGADLVAENGRWKIARIYNTESWNPGLSSPLDRPGMKVAEGNYLVGINGTEMTTADDPYKMLDGTADVQTVLHINNKPAFEGHWTEIVKPLRNENALRQRGWVEDNRRLVDSLSGGKLGYVWVPNTGGPGFVSFNRYYFAQQDKLGAVIDERFNGGGLLDDYMVDLMTRSLRAALTNEVPGGRPMKLPAGILGPKVLLINELGGSGGDFFPWVFRQQKAGPLIGARTWGGLVKSSVHYALVDGGALTAPDNAVFDPINRKWVAENEGVPPDIDVRQDAKSLQAGRDPQLERAVQEVLKLLSQKPAPEIKVPDYPTPVKTKN